MTTLGIDLGTTHTAVATEADDGGVTVVDLPQLVARGSVEARPLLPSFLYLAHESDGAQALPWDETRTFAVGEAARARGLDAPTRVIASAKSWLSHAGVDRRSPLLPRDAPDDVERLSPVEVSWRYLEHVTEALQHGHGIDAASAHVVLTVPASFDAAARELTVEAALAAGLENVTLLEEPQAALYAWLARRGDAWRKELRVGDVVLVVDVGGGTTDFSAIAVRDDDGALALERVAVGQHILLGGDNMDLFLAHVCEEKLDQELGPFERAGLLFACRAAKEALLADGGPDAVPIAVAKRGAKLLGGTLRTELTRDEIARVILEGFFPQVELGAQPIARPRAALRSMGLPYADDAAITRHLSGFLTRQATASGGEGPILRPTRVLFNGGVMKSTRLRERLLAALNGWLMAVGAEPAQELEGADYDLAVARGALAFGLARKGRGVRIRGGTARAYYVGIEGNAPAIPGVEPPLDLLCVAPFGMEEGAATEMQSAELGVVVGEPVRLRFFGSSVRRDDASGARFSQRRAHDVDELAPIEVTLPEGDRTLGDVVPVYLRSELTEVGTLKLFAVPHVPKKDGERWEIELSVRE